MKTTPFLIGPLLKSVSRSFYLTLRILPGSMREPVSLAYLLARATDTIADTTIIPHEKRREYLRVLNESIQSGMATLGLQSLAGDLLPYQSLPGERLLLENINACLSLLEAQQPSDQTLIRNVLSTICSGQDLDLQRFPNQQHGTIDSLQTAAELNDYTYRVAGCVGEFWTHMCLTHLDACKKWDRDKSLARGIHFGQALQLTNILRDLPRDLQNGRCYLPLDELAQEGLAPGDLLKKENFDKLRPLYLKWLALTESHYNDAWSYTLQYPRQLWRMRLACAWPVLIGIQTLRKLRDPDNNPLDSSIRIKVSRGEVWTILAVSSLCVFSNRLFSSLYYED